MSKTKPYIQPTDDEPYYGVEIEQLQDAFDTHLKEQFDAAGDHVKEAFLKWMVEQWEITND